MHTLGKTTLLIIIGLILVLQSCKTNNIDEADKYYKDENIPEAIKYYELAIAEGDTTAMNKLGLLYDNKHQP